MHLIRLIATILPKGVATLLLPVSLITAAHAEEPGSTLVPYQATYTASMNKGVSLNGTAKRTLSDQGNGVWLYRTDVDSFIADIDESLVLKWENNHVVPLRYRYRLSGFLIKDREQSIDFDWDAGVATGEYRGKPFELELTEGVLDPLGFQLQLSQDIKSGKRDLTYQVIDGGDYDHDRFAVLDKEPLKTSRGSISTLKAEKVRDKSSKRETLMWFAPDEDFLLVRLRQVEPDGSSYELRLNRADLGG
ncbi:DUF3108 domain-containing protein [Marinobacter sp. F4218]|uniref:DUF3108 domain-containing protein n=1 Tax=Marinobacter sp. F4218 TaxID=2862868 RepID=UPI001C633BDB|nr:DUF3108 domain-containing protein [Marinobacter sp. F4218]MBW7469421.1 DUF3108 domain-containing protein [Marinobacter sp. F4218]